jgi:HEPN domain-containing protein
VNLLALARDQYVRAQYRARDARRAMREHRLADATRYTQESVELGLKAALRVFGVEVPKRHDVAPAFDDLAGVLPAWFRKELSSVRTLSFELAEERSLAMYGDEKTGRPASDLFDRPDIVARRLRLTGHVLTLVGRLLEGVPPKGPGEPHPHRRPRRSRDSVRNINRGNGGHETRSRWG